MTDAAFSERYDRILDEVRRRLWEEWDPIGVRALGAPSDEYDSYAPSLASMLARDRPVEVIVDYLNDALAHMGLASTTQKERARAFGTRLWQDIESLNSAPARPRSAGMIQPRVSAEPRPVMEDRVRPEAWRATVVTLFPELFPGPLAASLTGKALKDGLWSLDTVDIRRFGEGRHRVVDDTPSGGGAGMVMRADILAQALDAARIPSDTRRSVYLSPRGRPFDQALAQELAAEPGLVLLCGRYEGVDQRVIDGRGLEEVSLGDFVLTGGEIAAIALIDAVLRLRPGVLGNADSAVEESFARGLLEHPQYTRPQIWEGRAIPEVLTSGDHARITRWRQDEAERLTKERRPELWRAFEERSQTAPEQSDAARRGRAAEEED